MKRVAEGIGGSAEILLSIQVVVVADSVGRRTTVLFSSPIRVDAPFESPPRPIAPFPANAALVTIHISYVNEGGLAVIAFVGLFPVGGHMSSQPRVAFEGRSAQAAFHRQNRQIPNNFRLLLGPHFSGVGISSQLRRFSHVQPLVSRMVGFYIESFTAVSARMRISVFVRIVMKLPLFVSTKSSAAILTGKPFGPRVNVLMEPQGGCAMERLLTERALERLHVQMMPGIMLLQGRF